MRVLIVRHAPAEDRGEFARSGKSDDLRPLSENGKKKMRENVQGLQTIVPHIHNVISSSLRRAQQTADFLTEAYPNAQRETLPALAPLGSASEILKHLQKYTDTKNHTIAIVGHEPDLGELTMWLVNGHTNSYLPLKKGAACLLEFSTKIEAGEAKFCWMLKPKQLRNLHKTGNGKAELWY